MKVNRIFGWGLTIAAATLLAGAAPLAQEEKEERWKDTADLSYVLTAGNTETSTLGFKNVLSREWERSSVEFNAGGIRAKNTTTTRTATGGVVTEVDIESTTAEAYFLNGQYNRNVTDRFFWFLGAGWDRNRFAGIQNRYTISGGVGNIWRDTDDLKFRTDYGLTFTDQEDVADNPATDDSFLGARFSWDYLNKLGKNATYTNSLIIDQNLDDGDDLRADMINALSVSMSAKLAIKVSLQWLYDNQPSLLRVPNTPAPPAFVFVELDELDTIFTTSLVINF